MIVLGACLVAHHVLALIVPSPWWVPDLTLVGLILAVTSTPRQWPLLSGLAGFLTMLWAIRNPQPVALAYGGLGGVVAWITRRLDASDVRVQCFIVGSAGLLLSLGALWFEDLWSLPLVGAMGIRIVMTTGMVPVVRKFL